MARNQIPMPMTPEQHSRITRLYAFEITRRYLQAGCASKIPFGERRGLWFTDLMVVRSDVFMPKGVYTRLARITESTMPDDGETVMIDHPIELSKHLNAAILARGSVLVTGLGLGCVARMLQANPRVEKITVVESSQDVIDLVWEHMPHDRIELVHDDAFTFLKSADRRWDCAWHDIWTDTDAGEPHLAIEKEERRQQR